MYLKPPADVVKWPDARQVARWSARLEEEQVAASEQRKVSGAGRPAEMAAAVEAGALAQQPSAVLA